MLVNITCFKKLESFQMRKIKEEEIKKEEKSKTIAFRMRTEDIRRFTTACSRDLIRPSAFAHKAILDAVEKLISKQKKHGYQCMRDL